MFLIALRSLLARRSRLALTVITIALGVGFTAGTIMLTDTTKSAVRTAITDVSAGADVVVRGDEIRDGLRAPVPIDVVDRLKTTPNISAVVPYYEGYAGLVGGNGKSLDVPQAIGMSFVDDATLSPFRLVAGRAPSAGEVVLDRSTADRLGVGLGDAVRLTTATGVRSARLSGLAKLESSTSFGALSFTLFNPEEAQDALGATGPQMVLVKGHGGEQLRSDVASSLADFASLSVVTGRAEQLERQADADRALGAFAAALMAFGIIALIVGAMTTANTFAVTTAQRTQELALLRAVGASRRQVLRSVMVEAVAIGAIATAIGLGLGVGMAAGLPSAMSAAGAELPGGDLQISATAVAAALFAGLVVTLAAAMVPARRATRIRPVEALREASHLEQPVGRPRTAAGVVMLAGAALIGGNAIATDEPALVGLATLLALAATVVLGPVALRMTSAVLAGPFGRLSLSAGLATANLGRSPKRAAATAMALTVGVALVSGASLFAATAGQSIEGDVKRTFSADAVLRPAGAAPSLAQSVARVAAGAPGVSALEIRSGSAQLGGRHVTVTAADSTDSMLRTKLIKGTSPSRRAGVAVSSKTALEQGWKVGDRVPIRTLNGQTTVRLSGTFAETSAVGEVLADVADAERLGASTLESVLVRGDRSALSRLDRRLEQDPSVLRESVAQYAKYRAAGLASILALILGLLAVAVVVAVLGIATTVGLSVQERTKEFGGLRAIGMQRAQLRRSVRVESVLLALVGASAGMAIGLCSSWGAVEAAGEFGAAVVPVPALALTVIGAVLAGTAAAALPARRAARRPVLEAMTAA